MSNNLVTTRASIDSAGGFYTNVIHETGHQPLNYDYTIWEGGQSGGIGIFGTNATENFRVLGTDPWGVETPVWETRSNYVSGDFGNGGGIYHSQLSIDNSKMYRMTFWENRIVYGTDTFSRYYFGLNGYGSTNGVLSRSSGAGPNTNPYFWLPSHSQIKAGALPEDEWVLVVGHVWPVGSGTGGNHPDSGRWQTDGTYMGNINTDYVWIPETTTARSRTLSIYRPNSSDVFHWSAYPRLDVIDGTEPSLSDLISGFDSNYIDYIRGKGGSNHISMDVGKDVTRVGTLNETGGSRGIQGWWTFDGDVTDISIGKNNGTIVGATFTEGLGQTCLEFDGEGDYVSVDGDISVDDFPDNNFTISAWFNWFGGGGGSDGRNSIFQNKGSTFPLTIEILPTNNTIRGWYHLDTSTAAVGGGNVQTNTWHHAVVVQDRFNDEYRVYLDGVKVANTVLPSGVMQSWSPSGVNIGTFRSANNRWMDGLIQDVRLTNVPFTDEEVGILYETTNPEIKKLKKSPTTIYTKTEFKEI